MKENEYLLQAVKDSVAIATGCTEPAAIALNAASAAQKLAPGAIRSVSVNLDTGLLKNAMFVGIPGVSGRGVELCAALGIIGGNPADGMNVLGAINARHEKEAAQLLPLVSVNAREDIDGLFIETIIATEAGASRAITYGSHDNIALVETQPFSEFVPPKDSAAEALKKYSLADIKKFADTIEISKIAFLEEGIELNQKIAEAGMGMGFGASLAVLKKNALWGDSIIPHIQAITGAASFARMSGAPLPVMIATGSGNQGITLFLTVAAAAEKLGVDNEKLLRGLAMALGVNLLSKAYLGALAPICACGVASGLGAAAGIVYIQDGALSQIMGAIRNMLGGVTGMICDGAKEGCANKVALSASYAALSAMTAMGGFSISAHDGILSDDLGELFSNVASLSKTGMRGANSVILDIMRKKGA